MSFRVRGVVSGLLRRCEPVRCEERREDCSSRRHLVGCGGGSSSSSGSSTSNTNCSPSQKKKCAGKGAGQCGRGGKSCSSSRSQHQKEQGKDYIPLPDPHEFRDLGRFPDTTDGHYAFGKKLGDEMKTQVQAFVYSEPWYLEAWSAVETDPDVATYSRYLRNFNEASYPKYFSELRGLAAGADVPFDRIWVAVGQQEVLGMQYTAAVGRPRGCSDIVTPNTVCHNEDGSVDLIRQGKFIRFGFLEAGTNRKSSTRDAIWATGFCYPGALPGWGPCYNSAGVAYSINFLFPESPTLAPGLASPFGSAVALASRDYAFSDSVWEPLEKSTRFRSGLAFGQNLNIGQTRRGDGRPQRVITAEQGPGSYAHVVALGRASVRCDVGMKKAPGKSKSVRSVSLTPLDPPAKTFDLVTTCRAQEGLNSAQPFVFHGNRYNRNTSNMPASSNPGPCKRTQQFDRLYRSSFEDSPAEILRVMSDGTTSSQMGTSSSSTSTESSGETGEGEEQDKHGENSDKQSEQDKQKDHSDKQSDEVQKTSPSSWPIFRARPDQIVSLFTVKYDFNTDGRVGVEAWRHSGAASQPLSERAPSFTDTVVTS
ncbi:unnamed protein product [Amoebophrya sp. A25]|nr:unnamed protein product [Amoebophrya sp. A25]|eukprot:GSA25T00020207001.1